MNVSTLKTKLYTIIQPILGGTVIWSDQSAPRPALPYVALKLGVVTEVGTEHYSEVDNNGIMTVQGVRESVLNVQRFGADSVSALQDFADKLRLISNVEKFVAQNISCYDVGNVTDIAELLNGISIEPRASVDLNIRFVSSQLDDVGVIEVVNVNGELSAASGTIETVNIIDPF